MRTRAPPRTWRNVTHRTAVFATAPTMPTCDTSRWSTPCASRVGRSQPRCAPVRSYPARRPGFLLARELDSDAAAGLGNSQPAARFGLGLWKKPEPYSCCLATSWSLKVTAGGVTLVCPAMPMASPPPYRLSWTGASSVRRQLLQGEDQVWCRQRRWPAVPRSDDLRGTSRGVDQQCPPVAKNQKNCSVDDPENVCLRHGEGRASDTSRRTFDGVGNLNLDHEGDGDWFQARHYARLQSRHEWCRLLHLSRDLDPTFVAAGRLLATWVGTDSGANTPHIPGTACQRGAVRRHGVEISATPGPDAPQSVPFVVFRSDFTSSARTTVGRQATKMLRICGSTNERIVATLMPTLTEGSTFVVPVPATARSWTVRDHRGGFLVTFTVKVTPNSC